MKPVSNMAFPWRKLLYYLGVGLGAILFLQQVWLGIESVRQEVLHIDRPVCLLAAIGLTFIIYALQMIAWGQIMLGLGSLINLPAVLQGYIISFLPRYIPGTIWGYLSRAEWLKSTYNVPHSTSTLGSVLEVGGFLSTSSMIIAVYYLWGLWQGLLRLFLIPGVLLVSGLIWYGLNPALTWFATIHSKEKASNAKPTIGFYRWFKVYIIYFIIWAGHGLSLQLLLNAFGTGYKANVFETTFIFTLSWLVGFAVLIVPSGLGVREFALASLLISRSPLLNETASVVAVISRLSLYLAEITWLLLVLSRRWFRARTHSG